MIENGIILCGDENAKKLGFTEDLFDGYLFKKANDIYISIIVSRKPEKGNLSAFFKNILAAGYNIKVPAPLGKMQSILEKKGFEPAIEYDKDTNQYFSVWTKNNE